MTTSPTALDLRTRDGRVLYGERYGTGTPVVVFESGMGASRNSWGAIVPAVAARTSAVVYDRSGLGRSAPADGPRDLKQLADDLVDVLGQLGDGPFVLVGHSWGGPIIRSVAARRRDLVAGLVLVDQTDENCALFFSAANARQTRISLRIMPLLARLGLAARLARSMARHLPEPWASDMRAEDGTRAAMVEQLAELRPCIDDLRRLRDEPLQLPDVPMSVISGGRNGFMERNKRGELIGAHRRTAATVRRGRHVMATNSSHYVPFTDAPLVIDEILRIVDDS